MTASPFAPFAPPITTPRLPDSDVAYAAHDTPVGRLLLASAAGRLVLCAYAADPAAEDAHLTRVAGAVSPRILRRAAPLDEARRQLDDYLAGQRHTFDLTTDLSLARPFQATVLGELTHTTYGHRTTYGALAAAIDHPGAARAVGTALAGNPLCIVLPCHRVVPAAGGLGGYAGGSAAKAALLALESRP